MTGRREGALVAAIVCTAIFAAAVTAATLPSNPVPPSAVEAWARIERSWGTHAQGRSFIIDTVASGSQQQPFRGAALSVARDQPLFVRGWAFDPNLQRTADQLVYRIDAGPWLAAQYHISRPDVAAALHLPLVADSGFEVNVPPGALAPGRHIVEIGTVTGAVPPNTLPQPVVIDVRGP